jgi:molybdate transport system substrate-binding protein
MNCQVPRTLLLATVVALASMSTWADEVRLVASNAVKEVVQELAPEFEARTGHRLIATWGGTPDVIRAAEEGQAFDLVIISLAAVTDLERRGKLEAGTHREFVASAIGAAVAPSGPRFDVSTSAGLRQALLAAKTVVLSSGPSSVHLFSLIESLGVRDVVTPKLLRLAPGQSVGEALAQGRGELGFTQVSELLPVRGIHYLGPLGTEVQRVTVFTFGMRPGGATTSASKALVEFLTSPEVAARVRHAGLEPR